MEQATSQQIITNHLLLSELRIRARSSHSSNRSCALSAGLRVPPGQRGTSAYDPFQTLEGYEAPSAGPPYKASRAASRTGIVPALAEGRQQPR